MNEQEPNPVVPGSVEMLRYALSLSTEKKQNILVNREAVVDVVEQLEKMTERLRKILVFLAVIGVSTKTTASVLEDIGLLLKDV